MAGEADGARASSGGPATPTHSGSSPRSESDSEVTSTIDMLDAEVRELYATLDNQKRLLKEAARERRKLRAELACAREKSSEDECAGCISHMNDLVALPAKHDENVADLDVAIGFSWLTSLELLLALLVACWLVLRLIFGSGIGDLDI